MTSGTGKTKVTDKGAVEIDEKALDQASGGAFDAFLTLDGIKGESKGAVHTGYDLKAAKKV